METEFESLVEDQFRGVKARTVARLLSGAATLAADRDEMRRWCAANGRSMFSGEGQVIAVTDALSVARVRLARIILALPGRA
jgi:hypothetical protein